MTAAPPDIIGRDEARALGLKRFFTGKPCRRGHVAERGVSNLECMECSRGRSREWRAANLKKARERARERARKYRAANPKKARERARERARKYRAANLEKVREREREYGRKRRTTNPGRVKEVRRAVS